MKEFRAFFTDDTIVSCWSHYFICILMYNGKILICCLLSTSMFLNFSTEMNKYSIVFIFILVTAASRQKTGWWSLEQWYWVELDFTFKHPCFIVLYSGGFSIRSFGCPGLSLSSNEGVKFADMKSKQCQCTFENEIKFSYNILNSKTRYPPAKHVIVIFLQHCASLHWL